MNLQTVPNKGHMCTAILNSMQRKVDLTPSLNRPSYMVVAEVKSYTGEKWKEHLFVQQCEFNENTIQKLEVELHQKLGRSITNVFISNIVKL